MTYHLGALHDTRMPTRSRRGPDRPCPMHTDDASDSVLGRMAAFDALSTIPGDRSQAGEAGEGEPDGSYAA